MPELSVSLSLALFWMNIYLEMLTVNGAALRRMRRLVALSTRDPTEYEKDTSLLVRELARVAERLAYWEAQVDRLRRALSPIDPLKALPAPE